MDWRYLGANTRIASEKLLELLNEQRKVVAFNGVLGENDPTKPNGRLAVHFNPVDHNSTLLLTGSSNLNGTLTASAGTVLLSGRPTPHAVDHLNQTEVIDDKDWITRHFTAEGFKVVNNASLMTSRNVGTVVGNVTASDNATVQFGFVNEQTPICVRSDYTGETKCTISPVDGEIFDLMPTTQVRGDVVLGDSSRFLLGKAHLMGAVTTSTDTHMNLSADSHWTMTDNSQVANLNLTNGAKVTLNNASSAQESGDKFNTPTITNRLSGSGQFNYFTNISKVLGDKVVVLGEATGNHQLYVQDTGVEPENANQLVLMQLASQPSDELTVTLANENQSVDLGAFRYYLKQTDNNYLLFTEGKADPADPAQSVDPVPVQADYISRYTNTALSALSAQMHSVMQVGHGIDRRVLRVRPHDVLEKGSEFWASVDRFDESHQSNNYRRYAKDETLTQIGLDTVLAGNSNVKLGVALSHSDASQRFDDKIRADGATNMVSIYGRADGKHFFVTADVGLGKGQYDIMSNNDKTHSKHTIVSAGVNVGATLHTPVMDIQPSVGARYHHLSDDTYHLNHASVSLDKVNLVSYQAGLALQKNHWTLQWLGA